MKQIVLFSLFCIVLSYASYGQKSKTNLTATGAKDIEVEVDVELGRKKFNCQKIGICDIVVSGGPKSSLVNNEIITYKHASHSVEIKISIDKFNSKWKDKKMYFEDKTFVTFEDEYEIPAWLKEKLNAPELKALPSGNHNILKVNGHYVIVIKL